MKKVFMQLILIMLIILTVLIMALPVFIQSIIGYDGFFCFEYEMFSYAVFTVTMIFLGTNMIMRFKNMIFKILATVFCSFSASLIVFIYNNILRYIKMHFVFENIIDFNFITILKYDFQYGEGLGLFRYIIYFTGIFTVLALSCLYNKTKI